MFKYSRWVEVVQSAVRLALGGGRSAGGTTRGGWRSFSRWYDSRWEEVVQQVVRLAVGGGRSAGGRYDGTTYVGT